MSSRRPNNPPKSRIGRKRGVVGVIRRDGKFLIIRRSRHVTAPLKLCLPGGTMEAGESEEQTLVREMKEELSIDVSPVRLCWRSITPWGTTLAWWQADLDPDVTPVPDPSEVAEYHWMSEEDIYFAKDMLPSLPAFIDAIASGEVQLD
ncbi:MAG: NUDIX domain-containing protein [Planctomycetota bacterium]